MIEQKWVVAGYKKYDCTHWKKHADFALQKCVRDTEGSKLYFINVFAYDWTKEEWAAHGLSYKGITFSYEVTLFLQDASQFTVSGEVSALQELENWIAHLYKTLNCIPDVNNN